MAKAIDNIKAWAKENVQLITILPENKNLQVKTRLKDILETSVDEKYYLSDEKTTLLVSQLENGLAVKEATKRGYAFAVEGDAVNFQFPNSATRRGRVGKQIANTLEASGVNQGVVMGCSTRTRSYAGQPEKLEVRKDFVSNSVTTVPKDSMILNAEVKQLGNVNPSGRGMNGAVYDINAGLSPTLTTNKGEGQRIAEAPYYRIRKLTPIECFRLQSFPDWAFHEAAEVNSNSQLYRQAGNSVTVNVIHEIAKRL